MLGEQRWSIRRSTGRLRGPGVGAHGEELANKQLPITQGFEALRAEITAPFIARILPDGTKLPLPAAVLPKCESLNSYRRKKKDGFLFSPPNVVFPFGACLQATQSFAGR